MSTEFLGEDLTEERTFNPYEFDRWIIVERRNGDSSNIDIFKPMTKPPCGTESGEGWHYRHEEVPCDECRAAGNAARRKRNWNRGTHKPRVDAPCGTYAAYRRHRSRGEEIDSECREASRADSYARKHK